MVAVVSWTALLWDSLEQLITWMLGVVTVWLYLVRPRVHGQNKDAAIPPSKIAQELAAECPRSLDSLREPTVYSTAGNYRWWLSFSSWRCEKGEMAEQLRSLAVPFAACPVSKAPAAAPTAGSAEPRNQAAEDVCQPYLSEEMSAPKIETQQVVLLPTEALHRMVSPAARSIQPPDANSEPVSRPRLFLPEMACADNHRQVGVPEAKKRRNITSSVSFLADTEWVIFDVDEPACKPIFRSVPLGVAAGPQDRSPESPRGRQLRSTESLSLHSASTSSEELPHVAIPWSASSKDRALCPLPIKQNDVLCHGASINLRDCYSQSEDEEDNEAEEKVGEAVTPRAPTAEPSFGAPRICLQGASPSNFRKAAKEAATPRAGSSMSVGFGSAWAGDLTSDSP